MLRQLLDPCHHGHRAGIVALALCTVNAFACAPRFVPPPEAEPAAWDTPLGTPSRAPSAAEALSATFEPSWVRDVGRSLAGPLAVGDSLIAAQATDRWLTVLERRRGRLVWRSRLHTVGAAGPIFAGDRLFAASGGEAGRVYGYDLLEGRRRWDRRVGPVVGPLAMGGRRVYAATRTGRVLALEAERGRIVWERALTGAVRVGPVAVGTALLVGVDDSLFLLDRDDGTVRARRLIPDAVVAPAAVAGERIAVSSPAGWVALLDGHSLTTIWEHPLGAATFASPVIARDSVFVTTLGGTLWTIPLAGPSGAIRRDLGAPIRAAAGPVGHGVLLGTVRGDILYLAGNEAPVWQEHVVGPIEYAVVASRGDVFVVDGSGSIHVWRTVP